jgi:hypothetical protein
VLLISYVDLGGKRSGGEGEISEEESVIWMQALVEILEYRD